MFAVLESLLQGTLDHYKFIVQLSFINRSFAYGKKINRTSISRAVKLKKTN